MAADDEQQPGGGSDAGGPPLPKGAASLQELYLQVRDKPCRVDDVRVEVVGPPPGPDGPAGGGGGLEPKPLRLKQEILDRELARVYEAATLREVHEALEASVEVLRQLEVFDDIVGLVDAQPWDEPDACSVQLVLQEVGRYKLGGGTYTMGGEYSFEGTATARNVLGVADQWSIAGEIGTRQSKNFAATFRLPRAGGAPLTPELRVFQAVNSQQLHSSWAEALRGVSLSVASLSRPGSSLAYEYGWRSLSAGTLSSRAVRSQAGDYLKASLRGVTLLHGGGWATGEVLPTEGWQLRLSAEVGGLAPGTANLRYSRGQGHLSWAAPLGEGASFHIEAAAGLLLPCWHPDPSKPSPLPERFYLGGVESNLRGFETRGVGPSEQRRQPAQRPSGTGGAADAAAEAAAAADGPQRDALGADLFSSLYAALMVRLPGKAGDLGVHGHIFANGGSAVLLSGSAGAAGGDAADSSSSSMGGALGLLGDRLKAGVASLGQTYRWSAGVGLVFPTQLGRLEANYAWVLTSQEHDRLKRGFSFGFAANMGL